MMRVFITGVEGYIGSLLCPILLDSGHDVTGLDTGYYRDGWLYSNPKQMPCFPQFLNKDLRNITAEDLEGFEAVVHLAELSNDPLGENSPLVTHSINHEGSVRLAEVAKSAGVRRFVYTSSCSVYGLGSGDFLDERADVSPQTAYARCKVLVERDVGALADNSFAPVFLRNATAYGASPRMRFDIVINNLAGLAWTTREIAMTSDGTPWRPLVHVEDICAAISCVLTAPEDRIWNQVLNVGDNEANYQIREVAEIIGDTFPGCKVTLGSSSGDNRSYRVCFDKVHSVLPDFECRWDARRGADQLRALFERIDLQREGFEFRAFTRLKQLQYLIRTRQIDAEFYWTACAQPRRERGRSPHTTAARAT